MPATEKAASSAKHFVKWSKRFCHIGSDARRRVRQVQSVTPRTRSAVRLAG
jgi:hypothetical protein